MPGVPDVEEVEVRSPAEWRDWLAEHHASSPGVWLVLFKKGRGPQVSWDELVDEAICFGWIDGKGRRIDDDRWAILVRPRSPASAWSGINKARVERLRAAGLMAPAGLAAVDAAKASGTWIALDEVEAGVEPDDLRAALDAVPAARAAWDGFPPSARRLLLTWIADGKRPETRARRVAATVSEAAEGRRAR